jgi:O-antigen ligase
MRNFLVRLDDFAAIETENSLAKWLERAAFVFMILMFAAAPHSIAATQIAWLTGMFLWVVRFFIKPRPPLIRTPLDVPLWIFFGWSIVSSIFSYDPPTSIDRLRNVALFLIFYFVINLVRTKRIAVFLAATMILSAMVSVVWTPIERIIGRGVEISGVTADSPLTKALIKNGDTLLKVNGKKINVPEDLAAEIEANELSKVTFYRPDYYLTVDVWRKNLLGGATAFEKLGFTDWKRSRNWRSAGFYGHYTTFAEVLQLIASLTLGLFIASFGKGFLLRKRADAVEKQATASGRRWTLILAPCLVAMAFALLLTVTRGSQLGFLLSATAMVFIVGSRKMLLVSIAIILPVAFVGLVFLQQSREVGFFDSNDDSTKYRQTVYREGINLWLENPRHFFLGVGMDSIKKYAAEWKLFDDGKLPMGHFHSTPIQLLVERGLPALLLWSWVLWIYARMLWRYLKSQMPDAGDWREIGIVLGCFGGVIGFLVAGLVHYNLGDAEVAMVFFMLMGLSVSIANSRFQIASSELI